MPNNCRTNQSGDYIDPGPIGKLNEKADEVAKMGLLSENIITNVLTFTTILSMSLAKNGNINGWGHQLLVSK